MSRSSTRRPRKRTTIQSAHRLTGSQARRNMARTIRIKAIDHRDDRTFVRVGKEEIEIPGDRAELRQWIRQQFDEEAVLALALACYLRRHPNLDNPAFLVGKQVTLDLSGRVDLPNAVVRIA